LIPAYERSTPQSGSADRENKEIIALFYLCFVLQFLTSGISTGQEDRLLITSLPLWIVAYLWVLKGLSTPQTISDSSPAS